MLKLRNNVIDYLSQLKLDYSIKLYPSAKTENLSTFIKSLKMRRSHDARDMKKIWSEDDCNTDPDIEFYCDGRLPVFNRWDTDNTKQVSNEIGLKNLHRIFFDSFFEKFGRQVVRY